jgi:hypothetical protein
VSGYDFSRAAKQPAQIPALAAAELQITENESTGAKALHDLLLFRHD